VAFAKQGHPIFACKDCRHQFAVPGTRDRHVERVYDESYFTGGGAGYDDYLAEGRLVRRSGARHARRLERYLEPGRLLDVGAAAGFLLQAFLSTGWRGEGVEPNPQMAEYGRAALGLDITATAFEDFETSRRCDLITMVQVISHFIEPAACAAKAHALLKPGGHLLIETWDRASITAKLFGRAWHEYSPPSVLHWFTAGHLSRWLAGQGFEEIARGRMLKWIDVAHARSLLESKLTSRAGRLAISPLRLLPPRMAVPYLGDDLFWLLLRRV